MRAGPSSSAGGVLFFFALGGPWLLGKLGISMDAFRIAGGILLFRIAVGMVLAAHERETREEEEEARSRADVSVFPLAIPLIAGPGAMASTMILVGQAGSDPRRLAAVFAMAAAVLALTWLALRLASPLGRRGGARALRPRARDLSPASDHASQGRRLDPTAPRSGSARA